MNEPLNSQITEPAEPPEHRYPYFLSLCLPAFNEELNIEATVRSASLILSALVENWEVVVVDDGSRDATAEIVRRLSIIDGRLRLVAHQNNRGYGAAVRSALRESRGDLILQMDSDGQFDLRDLPRLLDRIADYDLVVGYRQERAETGIRCLNAWLWNRVTQIVLGVKVTDIDCGYKLFRRRALDAMNLTATGACISPQILLECRRLGLRLCQVPVRHFPRKFGTPTGAKLLVIARAFRELVSLRLRR